MKMATTKANQEMAPAKHAGRIRAFNETNLQKFITRTNDINTLTNIWQQQSEGTVHEKYFK